MPHPHPERKPEDYYNNGTLGPNRFWEKEEDPPYGGRCKIECPHCKEKFEMWLKGYLKTNKIDGSEFISLRFRWNKPKGEPTAYIPGGMPGTKPIPKLPSLPKGKGPPSVSAAPTATQEELAPPQSPEDDVPF